MAVSQKLTLTQMETQSENYQVEILWTSTQTGQSYNTVQRSAYVYYSINGGEENAVTVSYTLPQNSEKVIVKTVIEVPAAEDGSAMLYVRTWMNTHISAGIVELEESLELKPMASTIVATDAVIGCHSVVSIARHGLEHSHSIRYAFGSRSGYLTEDGGISAEEIKLSANEVLFGVPESFYEEMPDKLSETCVLYCTTYLGDVQIGEVQETSFLVLADDSICGPQVEGIAYDINEKTFALTGNDRTFIRYHSVAECTLFPKAQNHASIKTKWINGTETTGDSLEIPNIDQSQILFSVEDSRGLKAEYVDQIDLIAYRHLTLASQIERDDPTSGNATLHYSGLFFKGSFGAAENDLVFEYKIDSGAYQTAKAEYKIESGGRYTADVKISGLDYRKVFNITARVSDRLEAVEKKTTLKKGVPVFDWGESDFVFHVPVKVNGNVDAEHLLMDGMSIFNVIYPVGTVYTTFKNVNPGDLFGGAWEAAYEPDALGYHWKRVS